jgi:hypothetical protein
VQIDAGDTANQYERFAKSPGICRQAMSTGRTQSTPL